jgi:hypothetical protein
MLCAVVVALGSWMMDAGAAYALEVPTEAALDQDAELLPVTLNPPGESLVLEADEPCISAARAPAADDTAANVQMDATGPGNGTQLEPEDRILEATRCGTLASFAAAGEPVFVANAASSGFGFGATLGQMAVLAGIPGIAKVVQAVAKRKSSNGGNGVVPGTDTGPGGTGGGFGGPGGGGTGSGGNTPPTPTPEPASTLLLVAGAALVGRAVQRRRGR